MRDVRADPPARTTDPLLELLRERVHPRPRPNRHGQPAARLIAGADPVPDRLVITTSQLGSGPQRAGCVKGLQDLHHFLRGLQARPPGRLDNTRPWTVQATQDEI